MDFQQLITGIIIAVVAGIISSLVFWLLTHQLSKTASIEFAKKLEKSKNKKEHHGKYRYRIRVMNKGSRDLIEIKMIVRITITWLQGEKRSYHTFLDIGDNNVMPIIHGYKSLRQSEKSNQKNFYTFTFYMSDAALREFQKNFYPESIRVKAKDSSLCLEDIFEVFKSDCELTVYVYGNNSLTGVRKLYESKTYKLEDALYGKYEGTTLNVAREDEPKETSSQTNNHNYDE